MTFMARKNQLDSCLPAIEFFFDNSAVKSFTAKVFSDIFNRNKEEWRIPSNRYASQVLSYLVQKEMMVVNHFLNNANQEKLIYSWKTQDEYTIMSGLKNDAYYAYYSSLFLHQLTLQIPKTVYLNFEHKRSVRESDNDTHLTQEAIDQAFNGSQRKSSLSFSFNDKKIILTNGKFTNKLGVIKRKTHAQCFEYTDLERTLIDIAVRPVYAGGVFEVREAFTLAKDRLNVKRLADYLAELNYIYPYHQVIGFYLEKSGYDKSDIELFRKEMNFNFYLTYDIRNKEFSEKWKLFYPKGI
jgi:predicted transcriptional regulator of viral defense system